MALLYQSVDYSVLKEPPGMRTRKTCFYAREKPPCGSPPLESYRSEVNGDAVRSCARSNPDATRPGNEHTERAALTINSRSRLLDLEASQQPSGGDGSIGEVSRVCVSNDASLESAPKTNTGSGGDGVVW